MFTSPSIPDACTQKRFVWSLCFSAVCQLPLLHAYRSSVRFPVPLVCITSDPENEGFCPLNCLLIPVF